MTDRSLRMLAAGSLLSDRFLTCRTARRFLAPGLMATTLFLGATGLWGATPVALKVDNLPAPLGIDSAAPRFSWQLEDIAAGARQSAYEIQVASSAALLNADHPDLWSSHRVDSSASIGIPYQGPALKPSTEYFWRVKVWDGNGKLSHSELSHWETGLLDQGNWHAAWIGWELPEEAAVRHANSQWLTSPDTAKLIAEKGKEERYAFRTSLRLSKPVKTATLNATGQDTIAAWINGTQVMSQAALPGWSQLPWKKFTQADATRLLVAGENSIAIELLHYVANPNGMATDDPPPMMATLVVTYTDGTVETFGSTTAWKTAIHPSSGWTAKHFDDAAWSAPQVLVPRASMLAEPLGKPWLGGAVKMLRRDFTPSAAVRSARLYATALGAYQIFLNGKRVGTDVMAPGWTDYRERVAYQSYDVTHLVSQGNNALSALLAAGWYAGPMVWFQQPNSYGTTQPALRAMLRLEHLDGSVEWITTDSQWKAAASWIPSSEIYDGEAQIAPVNFAGWNLADKPLPNAQPVTEVHPAAVRIEAQNFEPIRVERTLSAKTLSQPKPGVWVYDFGQNLSGVPTLRVSAPAGTNVQLRYAEIVNDDGTIYTDNLRTAKATDHFVLAGKGVEEFTPQFTFHGFRYVELTGLPQAPAKDAVTVAAFHTDAPITVKLETGSAMINQLWSNILWGQRSNFVGLPTDCPQRDERLGWTADAQVFWRAASYNMDLAAFSRKYAGDLRSTQAGTPYYGIYAPGVTTPAPGAAAAWSDVGVIVPWTSWLQTGSPAIIEENWAAMVKYLDAIEKANPDGLWAKESGIPFGDWLSPEGKTDQVLVATAYYAWDVTLMRQMAHATGRTEAEQKYAALFEKIRSAFQKKFVHEDGFIPGADNTPSIFGVINNPNARSTGGDTQTSYVLALHMNLLPESLRAVAADRLIAKIHANHEMLATGFLGTPYLLEELTKAGHQDLAFQLLLNTGYPSWGYMVEHGATTMWERWNGDQMKGDPSMNSYNHYAYGAVADWIYRYAAGVDATPEDPGFRTVVLNPHFDARLGHVDFSYQSPMGTIRSAWKVEAAHVNWTVTLPANTAGWLPVSEKQAAGIKLNGKPLNLKQVSHGGTPGYELPAGTYNFAVAIEAAH